MYVHATALCAMCLLASPQHLCLPRKNHCRFQHHLKGCLVTSEDGAAPSCSPVLLTMGGGGRAGRDRLLMTAQQASRGNSHLGSWAKAFPSTECPESLLTR